MKSFILAATAATAVSGLGLLELGLGTDMTKSVNLGSGLSVHLPQGINEQAVTENKPTSAPPPGYVNIWHPSHPGIVIDGCDDEADHDWHWVHPCGDNCKPEQPDHVWSVSTVSVTSIHTVISCAPTVTNCPANGHHTTTIVIPETTTFCPVEASKTAHPGGPSTAAYPPAASSPAYSAPAATNTGVVTLSTQTVPAPTGPAGYPAPSNSAAVPSGPASAPAVSPFPAYPVPGNSSAPAYTAPSTSAYSPPTQSSPAGCSGDDCTPSSPSSPPTYSSPPNAPGFPADGCSGAYCAPPPAGTAPGTAAPVPTGNSTTPLPISGAVSRTQGVSMALFGGVIAALFL
ncbi:uncharacterized protein TRIVIDRAFT_216090 [Trichoderma virens Gv29-8]|uniref:Uncharacterized protein n=1 Tax=Hypocrea virens (strain Gv29-8 / FGSC 10586) TaxID=413071 RepID=G9MRH5_HYPVG|nr:uncharacterized protein TRIVIDRAFT_216090 [Trichoderma virens Gv29-8]EHK22696.1 hypothetical protein TRIVIDRAFT_216090 [Trichoderma virens Gv29-8]UKZ47749.1 hypothetical protein TrVGV298_001975 [Trichoderma virens]